jgi:hypothetical protein
VLEARALTKPVLILKGRGGKGRGTEETMISLKVPLQI